MTRRAVGHGCVCMGAVLAIAVGALPAVAERLPVRAFGTADGLASARVTGVATDARGFLWFATMDGVSRFDGARFEVFRTDDGLGDNACNGVRVMADGAVWVATDRGLARLDPDATGIRPRFTAIHVGTTRDDDTIFTAFEDTGGRRWLGTAGGLWRFAADGSVAPVALGPGRQPDVYVIVEDRGALWLGTSRGLVRRHADGTVERYPVRAHPDDRTPGLHLDRAGRLWIGNVEEHVLALVPPPPGTRVAPEGVPLWQVAAPGVATDGTLRLPRAPGELVGYRDDAGFPAHGVWWGIGGDSRGDVWFGAHRLTRFDGTRFIQYRPDQGVPGDLAPVVEDRAGNLWFGSQLDGAIRLAPRGLVSFDQRDGLDTGAVQGVTEDADGAITVTTYAGLHVLNRYQDGRFVAVRPRMPTGLPLAGAWGTTQIELVDRDGRWWYATSLGAARFPRVARLADLETVEPAFFGVPEGMPGKDVLRMFASARGDVWLATMAPSGIARWDRATDRVHAVRDPALPTGPAWAFAEDRGGGVWVGFEDGRLVRLPGDGTAGLRVLDTRDGLPGPRIQALLVDRRGRLWIATHGGVARLDEPERAGAPIRRYTTADGLATDLATSLVEDLRGRIHVGTMRGVDRIDPETGAIGHLSTADGLPQEFVGSAFRARDGAIWFGTGAGVARYLPEDDRPVPPPQAFVVSVRAGGTVRPLAMGGAIAAPAISVAADDGALDVGFTSPSFETGLPVQLEYRLAGAERAWTPAGSGREVRYAHLAPGHYRFLVRARHPGGAWSTPAGFAFEVRPPLWRRPWFIALALTVIALVGWQLYRWRVRHLLAVERVRTRIATDLHDDLGASLSRISILSEVAARGGGARGVDAVIGDIGASARELVDVASDIVWSTDPARDDLGQLVVRLRTYAGDVLDGGGVAWALHAPPEPGKIKLDPDQRRHLFLIVKEALNNAARHAGARRVEVTMRRRGRELEVAIEDDGCGLDPAATHAGNGLRNMRARAAQAGGALTIETPPGGGTRLTLRLPLAR